MIVYQNRPVVEDVIKKYNTGKEGERWEKKYLLSPEILENTLYLFVLNPLSDTLQSNVSHEYLDNLSWFEKRGVKKIPPMSFESTTIHPSRRSYQSTRNSTDGYGLCRNVWSLSYDNKTLIGVYYDLDCKEAYHNTKEQQSARSSIWKQVLEENILSKSKMTPLQAQLSKKLIKEGKTSTGYIHKAIQEISQTIGFQGSSEEWKQLYFEQKTMPSYAQVHYNKSKLTDESIQDVHKAFSSLQFQFPYIFSTTMITKGNLSKGEDSTGSSSRYSLTVVISSIESVDLLKLSKNLCKGKIILAIDAQFEMGPFYLTPVVWKCTIIEQEPTLLLGYALHTSRDAESYSRLLQFVHHHFPNQKDFVMDNDDAIKKAINQYFEQPNILLCELHEIQTIERKMQEIGIEQDHRKQILQLFRGTKHWLGLNQTSTSEFEESWKTALERIKGILGDSSHKDKLVKFTKYLQDYKKKDIRTHIIQAKEMSDIQVENIITSNIVESRHSSTSKQYLVPNAGKWIATMFSLKTLLDQQSQRFLNCLHFTDGHSSLWRCKSDYSAQLCFSDTKIYSDLSSRVIAFVDLPKIQKNTPILKIQEESKSSIANKERFTSLQSSIVEILNLWGSVQPELHSKALDILSKYLDKNLKVGRGQETIISLVRGILDNREFNCWQFDPKLDTYLRIAFKSSSTSNAEVHIFQTTVTCNCRLFLDKKFCSHLATVLVLTKFDEKIKGQILQKYSNPKIHWVDTSIKKVIDGRNHNNDTKSGKKHVHNPRKWSDTSPEGKLAKEMSKGQLPLSQIKLEPVWMDDTNRSIVSKAKIHPDFMSEVSPDVCPSLEGSKQVTTDVPLLIITGQPNMMQSHSIKSKARINPDFLNNLDSKQHRPSSNEHARPESDNPPFKKAKGTHLDGIPRNMYPEILYTPIFQNLVWNVQRHPRSITIEEKKSLEIVYVSKSNDVKLIFPGHFSGQYIMYWGCFKRLFPRGWLNDNVINVVIYYISLTNPNWSKVYVFPTDFLLKLRACSSYNYPFVKRWTHSKYNNINIFEHEKVLLPAHGGSHWWLVVVDFQKKQLIHIDSMKSTPSEKMMEDILQYLDDESKECKVDFDKSEWKVIIKDVPSQENGVDCGVHMLLHIIYTFNGWDVDFTRHEIEYYRERMMFDLVLCQNSIKDHKLDLEGIKRERMCKRNSL